MERMLLAILIYRYYCKD